MKKYNLINNTLGWLVFLVAAVTYLLTIEPTASFWDCPEFIAQGFKSEIGHPPGNPIFILTARFATLFAGGDVTAVAKEVHLAPSIRKQLMSQMEKTTAITQYPGTYILARYTNFAFLDAYNNHADPAQSLLGHINAINKEITRKRTEFNLETLEVGQTLASKRLGQARDAIDALDGSVRSSDAVKAALAAIESEDIEALRSAAEDLGTSGELGEIASYMNDAAYWLEDYLRFR